MNITRQISKFNFSEGNNVQYIVIHDTGNTTDSAKANANYFQVDRKASAHYFVDDNSIFQVVEETSGAWHCGDGGGKYGITNKNSLGIEMCRVNNEVTAITEVNTLDLVRMLMRKYNVPAERVVRHYDASRKNCPSSFSTNNWERWNKFREKIAELPQANRIFRVQVGAFGEESNAKAMLEKLKQAGFDGIITRA